MHLHWHKAPLVRITIPLALGIVNGFFLYPSQNVLWFSVACAMLAILCLVIFRKHWRLYNRSFIFGMIATVIFYLLGISLSISRSSYREYSRHFAFRADSYQANVIDYPTQRAKSTRVLIRVTGALDSLGAGHGANCQVLAYFPFDLQADTLIPGDELIFSQMPRLVEEVRNPGQFDFRSYLTNLGVVATVYLRDDVIFQRNQDDAEHIVYFLPVLREKAISALRSFDIDNRELGVISALVLGKRELVESDLREAFTNTGTVHILAVSGLHVGIIYLFAASLLGKIMPGRSTRLIKLIIVIALLWLYAGITGFSPSVLRAATMFSFLAVGKFDKRVSNVYNMLAASALVLLLFDPFLILQVGFQLSYLAVTGIVYLFPKIYGLAKMPTVFLDKAWALFCVSVAAQIATFPLSVYYFNQFPVYFFLSNLLVIPLATAILYSGLICVLLAWLPFINLLAAFIVKYTTWMLNEIVLLFGILPHPVIDGLRFSGLAVIVVYGLILTLVAALENPRRASLLRLGFFTTLILCFHIRSSLQTAIQTNITCLHVDRLTTVVVANGRQVEVFTDCKPEERETLDFQTAGLLSALRPTEIQWSDPFSGNNDAEIQDYPVVLAAGEYLISCANDLESLKACCNMKVNAVILSGKFPVNEPFPVECTSRQTTFIVDGSTPPYHLPRLREWIDTAGIEPWETAIHGAFSLE